jgi:hypothetical protein
LDTVKIIKIKCSRIRKKKKLQSNRNK